MWVVMMVLLVFVGEEAVVWGSRVSLFVSEEMHIPFVQFHDHFSLVLSYIVLVNAITKIKRIKRKKIFLVENLFLFKN